MEATKHDLRCACPHATKLGEYGRNANGDPFFHVKVYKSGRVFGEVLATSGTVTVLCRDCARWTTVRIKTEVDVTRDVARPVSLAS